MAKLEELKRLNLRKVVDAIREELESWWDKCFYSREQRNNFEAFYEGKCSGYWGRSRIFIFFWGGGVERDYVFARPTRARRWLHRSYFKPYFKHSYTKWGTKNVVNWNWGGGGVPIAPLWIHHWDVYRKWAVLTLKHKSVMLPSHLPIKLSCKSHVRWFLQNGKGHLVTVMGFTWQLNILCHKFFIF